MPSLTDFVRRHTDLDDQDVAWFQLLLADWQIIADLSFADLVLWLPDREGTGFWAGAQMRPTTGPTAYVDDVVGSFVPTGRRPMIDQAYSKGRLVREGDPEWRDDVPVRVETIPVRRSGRVLGVVARNTNLLGVRTPSRLELSYLQSAADLTQMIASGHFPVPGPRSDHADSPRVGDGFVRLDAEGKVVYASPNALSVYRRLGLSGDLAGLGFAEVTRELVPARRRPDEETVSAVLGGRAHRDTELGTEDASLIVRAIPLRPQGDHIGALVLLRDVTDLRRRDRELVTKDATIREIHHRVKNNLQTVAALLRLQARRIESSSAKSALEEAVRRVGSIAIVHETLSQAVEEYVDFDEIADRLGSMVTEVSAVGDSVRVRREGAFGVLDSGAATALAMVLTEVLQNAVQHGYAGDSSGGTIVVSPRRLV
ncbi:MAG: histidine kinase N-terminal domain-containing protein, partial [Nocardioides sp.]